MGGWLDQVFVYHPSSWEQRDWARLSRLPLEEVWFQASDGVRLFGWYLQAPDRSAKPATLLWCHGNAGNIVHRLDNLAQLHRVGLSVFLFDYRGYGRSQGSPCEEGLYRDALAAYAYVTEVRGVPAERLVLFGRSLGGAVAAVVGSQRPAAGLILESAFPSVEAVARHHYFGLPAHWLLGARFNLVEQLHRFSRPTLVIHGDRDRIIPLALGRQVFDAANEPKTFYLVSGASHNDLYVVGGRAYFERLKRFVKDVVL